MKLDHDFSRSVLVLSSNGSSNFSSNSAPPSSSHAGVAGSVLEPRTDRHFADSTPAQARRLLEANLRAALVFAGQGVSYLEELRRLERHNATARQLIHQAAEVIQHTIALPEFRKSGFLSQGLNLVSWLHTDGPTPDAAYLASSIVSQPLVLLVQAAHFMILCEEGLGELFESHAISALSGHSQGVMTAILVAEHGGKSLEPARVMEFVRYYLWQGLHMQHSFGLFRRDAVCFADASPMLAISGVARQRLEQEIAEYNHQHPARDAVFVALINSRTRHVVSGPAKILAELVRHLEARAELDRHLRQQGRLPHPPLQFAHEFLNVSAAFHSPYMQVGLERMRETVRELDFRLEASKLRVPVLHPGTGEPLNSSPDLTQTLLTFQFLEPVNWTRTVRALAAMDRVGCILDLGPGDAVAKLTAISLRGAGIPVFPLATPGGRRQFFLDETPVPTLHYPSFAPSLVRLPDGSIKLDNRFSRFTGRPPIILPGMTPTTADAPIVAAAANAGFIAELAGGGQVTEKILRLRLEELSDLLEPGQSVVFNALYLDPYLWDLQFRSSSLIPRLKKAGAPLCGVTISAGIPEPEEAVRLLDELESAGLRFNAFKPGTLNQIDSACKIAELRPSRPLMLHLEGGKAGGHHSWEDLDFLLLERYHTIRQHSNLILCVGGGIASESDAIHYLSGSWSQRFGEPPMPVDAVFLGTAVMACAEARTSSSVKNALAQAEGTSSWVLNGTVEGSVTSSKSQLNADIYYLDNTASRVGALLEKVASDPRLIEKHRTEIITGLNQTARPYFGDLVEMSYGQVLTRLLELLAIGQGGRYEDGVWLDISYRERFSDFLRRAEARLSPLQVGEFPSIIRSLSELDRPKEKLERFFETYPGHTNLLHPMDTQYFLDTICSRPGKPVPFVPVINSDLRRWYKADSLWAAHDERYSADQVLTIPGPMAVRGIHHVDEKVGDLLSRFEQAAINSLLDRGIVPRAVDSLTAPRHASPLPPWLRFEREIQGRTILTIQDSPDTDALCDVISSYFSGPIARFVGTQEILEGTLQRANPLRLLFSGAVGSRIEILAPREVITSLRFIDPLHRESVVVEVEPFEKVEPQNGPRLTMLRIVMTPQLAYEPLSNGHGGRIDATSPSLTLHIEYRCAAGREIFLQNPMSKARSWAHFYLQALFGRSLAPVRRGENALSEGRISQEEIESYHAAIYPTNDRSALALHQGFSLAWEPLFRVLCGEDLAGGLPQLVHLSNELQREAGWPFVAGDLVRSEATLTRLEDDDTGRTVTTLARLSRVHPNEANQIEPCMTIVSRFRIRERASGPRWLLWSNEPLAESLHLPDRAAVRFFLERCSVNNNVVLIPNCHVHLRGQIQEERREDQRPHYRADVNILLDGRIIGHLLMDQSQNTDLHPLRAVIAALQPLASPKTYPVRTLASTAIFAPASLATFAEAGRDRNPIHASPLMARLAGLSSPIVHGMWTSARAEATLLDAVCDGESTRIRSFNATFLNPVLPSDKLQLQIRRVKPIRGQLEVEILAHASRHTRTIPVLTARSTIAFPTTAYVFPGQGIQRQNMGMDGYARSQVARRIWDQADEYTREALGFSLLRIVRENPPVFSVGGNLIRHEHGVLHLTQFTQVAMAVLASAQVAELREAELFDEGGIFCGHSVGEYNALGAMAGFFPLERLVDLVYQRGCTMHRLIARSPEGTSGFGMGVVRPNLARLSEADLHQLISDLTHELDQPLEIVNHNIRGKQYSVTGTVQALQLLEKRLKTRTPEASKPAYVAVPGIDVPFHSRLLQSGVDSFRHVLNAALPDHIDASPLFNRYIPNLVALPFSLDPAFLEAVSQLTRSPVIDQLRQSEGSDRNSRARQLLIEVLAWQFASPVRWIETQDLLFKPKDAGGLGVTRLIEVGVGYQPTLASMARLTLIGLGSTASISVLNCEADRDRVFLLDTDPEAVLNPDGLASPDTTNATVEGLTPHASTGSHSKVSGEFDPAKAAGTPSKQVPAALPAVVDFPVTVKESLLTLLALQARVRPEQVRIDETIDQLFEGVSSRRNQVLVDLASEFDIGAIEGAHEKKIADLTAEIAARAPRWKAPGKYSRAAQDETITRLLGRSGLSKKDLFQHLERRFSLNEGSQVGVLNTLLLETRSGQSARGGSLGAVADGVLTTRADALTFLDNIAKLRGSAHGVTLQTPAAREVGVSVDAGVVDSLKESILGYDSVLGKMTRYLNHELGLDQRAELPLATGEQSPQNAWLALEHGNGYEALIAPRFNARRYVAFLSTWSLARTTVAEFYLALRQQKIAADQLEQHCQRILDLIDSPSIDLVSWYAKKARSEGDLHAAFLLDTLANAGNSRLALFPTLDRALPRHGLDASSPHADLAHPYGDILGRQDWISVERVNGSGEHAQQVFWQTFEAGLKRPLDFSNTTALVTGAGPASIALEICEHLLRGGARVIITSANLTRERRQQFQSLYTRCASRSAELHLIPYNQASITDTDALVDWLFELVTEQEGASFRTVKLPLIPNLLIPFGAIPDLNTIDQLDARSLAAFRALLVGVERLIGKLASHFRQHGRPETPLHVLLPLSPNHGSFGGDGLYSEAKAGLEVLLEKWRSESAAWGRFTSLTGARIGWVRGTGLMQANDGLAEALEHETGVRTFSSKEMGYLLATLCSAALRALAEPAPCIVDLSGGFNRLKEVRSLIDALRESIQLRAQETLRLDRLVGLEQQLLNAVISPTTSVSALPDWPILDRRTSTAWRDSDRRREALRPLHDWVVIVGLGELGPLGHSRTRFEMEVDGKLSPAAILELAWMTGLIRFDSTKRHAGWVDVESGEGVEEHDIHERYGELVKNRVGIRFLEPEHSGFDPEAVTVLAPVYLEQDFTFTVANEEEARSFLLRDLAYTRATRHPDGERYQVTRLKGATIHVPRQARLSRRVAGQLPSGFDFRRYGIPQDMVNSIDRITLFNLVATVDAFLSAGLRPEELLETIHPARVGNTQGSGIGGMRSLRRLYLDHLLGQTRQTDVLQETLINVVASYVVQSYVGSYGPMSHPVGACATAAVSIEDAVDKIRANKADFVVAGGFDDIGLEGAIGFSDMAATANTDQMLAMGLEPDEMSRANDIRRRGFIEAQGGGTLLLTRGDLALSLGLPVRAVVAYAGSFSDGIQKSIPAPGIGILACALGGTQSPLGQALLEHGLTTDDIALVYKHDTSTAANDPNESALHHHLQRALERSKGNPLFVVSQKTLTGHAKGGAAAWQSIGLIQALETGVIPGNRNLESVDPLMRGYDCLVFPDRALHGLPGDLKAGLVTSLGFGHVGAIVLLAHASTWEQMVPEPQRSAWQKQANSRRQQSHQYWAEVMMGQRPAYEKRAHRRFNAPDGTEAQQAEEVRLLTDPDYRLHGESGTYAGRRP